MAERASDETRARRYHARRFVLAVADLVVGTAVLVAWIASGAAGWLADALLARIHLFGAVAGMVVAVGASTALATFPLGVLGGFVLPRRAGLLIQGFRDWLADRAKAAGLRTLLALLTAEIVYALLAWSPQTWWLWAAVALLAVSVVLAAIVPVWLIPLFYRLTPLDDPALRTRLLALAGRVGVPAADVVVADFSRKGPTANAAVVGLGRTRRILISDTLFRKFPVEEVEVVLAHELAHHARGHLVQKLAVQAVVVTLTLFVADQALRAAAGPLALAGLADPAGVPFLLLVTTALGLLATPPLAAWSRRLEREADRLALRVTAAPAAFVGAMERLAALNLAERRPPRWRELLLATHPSIEARIALARAADAPRATAATG